jgi:hypothetical protein
MESILQEELSRLRQLMLSEEMVQSDGYKKLKETIDILKKKDKVLLLSCSNRYQFDPKNLTHQNQDYWPYISKKSWEIRQLILILQNLKYYLVRVMYQEPMETPVGY